MTGWLIFLGIIAAIAVLPVGASVCYDESGPEVKLIIGPIKILLFPRPKKEKKEKKKETKKPGQQKKKAPADSSKQSRQPIPDGPPEGAPVNPNPRPKEKKGGSLTDFLPLVDVAIDMLNGLKNRLRVEYLRLRLVMAGDDPADLAIHYGRAQAAGAALLAQLDRFFVIKKQDVDIQCDFTADEMKILARLDLTITVGRVISLAVIYGVRALFTFLKIKKQREGGASI